MFYGMIEKKRNQWLSSDSCTVKSLIAYIEKTGQMRDAQIEAIKTYLFLKIACDCRSLVDLFCNGAFNTLDLDELELSGKVRSYLSLHSSAAALYEYASQTDEDGKQVSTALVKQIKKAPDSIDYAQFFRNAFYGVTYTDYLFSLPMGAGKTYLMAAFIYLDLYFALNEPQNPAFAHNFIIFAPSGLKSSVVPSLKTIQNFNPAWIIPEPSATRLKRMISFEVLDEQKTAKKSNKTKNPNVQKIAAHQPLSELFGLVAVTNAEKVILDRIKENKGQISFFEDSYSDKERQAKDRQANELRHLIGKLPSLAVFIDEVHHAVTDEIKLRAVVNQWTENRTVNSVIGFSGTPYLEKAEKIPVADKLTVASAEISNIVYYYPLIDGIGNFLKRPVVKIVEQSESSRIIEAGVRAFFENYRDTVYEDGLTAKLGIYCGGRIEKLEEEVYPLVSRIVEEYGIPTSSILKFYRKDRESKYTPPADSQMRFDTLDSPVSTVRIVLLVQIGKEGWDCRSLTGIILSQEGDCPKNMVLQTSCRCLRQVKKGSPETALIYLNDTNAKKLNEQLQQQYHITLKELSFEPKKEPTEIKRYNRMKRLNVPPIDFYQLKVYYDTLITEHAAPERDIPLSAAGAEIAQDITKTAEFGKTLETTLTEFTGEEHGTTPATFTGWLLDIVKGSFSTLSMGELRPFEDALKEIFEQITYEREGIRYYSSRYDRSHVNSNIRKAFSEKRSFATKEDVIPECVSLLNIANFTPSIETDTPERYFPAQEAVKKIDLADRHLLRMDLNDYEMIKLAEAQGYTEIVQKIERKYRPFHNQDRAFHYMPYHTDSDFEQTFLREVLTFEQIEKLGLEVYYNGDRALTEFKIKCYKRKPHGWSYVGMYTPDFLILQRQDGHIHKVLIVETKGAIYANEPSFLDRKAFTEGEFLRQNNQKFGYERFEYLYLEDSLPEHERLTMTQRKICAFFEE